jgi:putative SOS response-associated peptidase YedK
LVPFWAHDPKIGNQMINARSESAADKPAFKHSFRAKRRDASSRLLARHVWAR